MNHSKTTAPRAAEKLAKDPERTKSEILEAAITEFAAEGLNGARVDDIASRTNSTKGMIYYYFGGKEKLYIASLEYVYTRIRQAELRFKSYQSSARESLRSFTLSTVDYHLAHPEFVKLVRIENANEGRYLSTLDSALVLGSPVLKLIEQILVQGQEEKVFRLDVSAKDVHLLISALALFPEGWGYTFERLFNQSLHSEVEVERLRLMVADVVERYVSI